MDFEPNDDQRLVIDTARGYARAELAPKAALRDREELFPHDELKALGRLGLLGVNVPEALGGSAAGVVAYSLAVGEIAAVDASVAVTMAVTNMVAEVLTAYGTRDQAARRRDRTRDC